MIDGVRKIDFDGGTVYFIDSLSDSLKKVIRERLSSICHGSNKAGKKADAYSYKKTVRTFVTRYNPHSNDNNWHKGMIGELLVHVLMSLENTYLSTSAFFNLEEENFKKGFDLGFFNKHSQELWFTEVKSGEKKKSQHDQTSAVINLISTAKRDMERRLNSENRALWLNAINHALLAVNETNDEKKAIIALLETYSNQAEQGEYLSEDKNVILVGVLFHTLNEEADPRKIEKNHNEMKKEMPFNKLITVAIQQNTYEEIFRFLQSEGTDE